MRPKVSILVPIYKIPELYLRTCIESLINQTLHEIEIILVDDGSPDKCGDICDEYAEKDARIKVIHKENEGLAAARNTAFDNSTGECITFLDGDDYLEYNACELAYKTLSENNVELVMWNQITEYSNSSKRIFSFGEDILTFDQDGCKNLQIRVLDFNGKIAQVFAKLIRSDFLRKHNIRHVDELKQGAEGFVFNIQLFQYLSNAIYIPNHLLHYRYNEESISHTPNEKNYYLIIRCFEYIRGYIKGNDNERTLEEQLFNRILYVIVTTAITGYFNPVNPQNYSERVRGFSVFLDEPLVKLSLQKASTNGLGIKRVIILTLIKMKWFRVIDILGRVRRYQLGTK